MSFDASREKNVGILQQAVQLLEAENRRLIAQVVELTRELAKARNQSETEALQLKLAEVQAQLDKRNQMLFASSSEKRGPEKTAGNAGGKGGPKPEDRHTGGSRKEQPQLRIESVMHDLDDADKSCKACGGALEEWVGKTEDSEEVHTVTRTFVMLKHMRKMYRCKCGGCIETAPAPLKLHPGARYSIDFAIEVVIGKYRDHLPLERQVRAMKHDGLLVDSQVLFDLCARVAELVSAPYAGIGALIRSLDVIGGDETRWPVHCHKSGATKATKWHAWVLASDDAVYYEVHDSRSADAAKRLLGDFRGTLMVDGYSAYRSVAKQLEWITLAHCWAHVRREFIDIEKAFPTETERILHLIGLLYRIEKRAGRGRENDARRRGLRQRRSRVVLRAIERWVLSISATPGSGLIKAIQYMAKRWTALTRFVDNPRIPLDNNGSERGLRGLVVGRKNHYGSRSKRGSEVAAKLYTVIETCKLLDLDPRTYLRAAIEAKLRGEHVPLPHEMSQPAADAIAIAA